MIVFGGRYQSAGVYDLLWILLASSPLMPFVIASASIERREWPRVLGAIFIGLAMGVASAALFFLAFIIVLPAAALGLVFGLTTLVTRWRDGACRALAMLGLAPTLLFFVMSEAETVFRPHHGDQLLGAILTQAQWSILVTLLLLISHVLVVTWAVRRVRTRLGEKSVPMPDDLC